MDLLECNISKKKVISDYIFKKLSETRQKYAKYAGEVQFLQVREMFCWYVRLTFALTFLFMFLSGPRLEEVFMFLCSFRKEEIYLIFLIGGNAIPSLQDLA